MKIKKFTFIIIALLILNACASREKRMNQTVGEVSRNLITVYSSKNRPWPEFNVLKHPILFVSFKEELLYRFINGELQTLNIDEWKNKVSKTEVHFDRIEIDDDNYLVIHLDNVDKLSTTYVINTILHEGFHFFEQVNWHKQKNKQGRGTIYPLQSIPRYYRWEMRQSLVEYLKRNTVTNLGNFNYWFVRWKLNFPEEYQSLTDRNEGTAEYYANQMLTLLNNMKGAKKLSPEERFLNSPMGQKSFQEKFDLGFESYYLGTLAGIILDQKMKSSWQKTVKLGVSPLELLARNYKSKKDTINGKVQTEFLKASVREMNKIDRDGKLDQIISNLANPNLLKIAIPTKGVTFSSFSAEKSYRSFFNFPGIKDVQMFKLSSTLTLSGKDFSFPLKDTDIWVTARKTPCGSTHSTLLALPKEDVQFVKNKLSVRGKNVELSGLKKEAHKTQWFCAQ